MRDLVVGALRTLANIDDWSGRWVHYSKVPYMKINPKQMHADPAGIYLFPEEFVDEGQWEESYPYKFIVELPSLKVLDLAEATPEEMIAMVEKALEMKNQKLDAEDKAEILESSEYLEKAWKYVWHRLMTDQAKWNKALRELGYDAVFDDTRAIHPSEVQLILLDPRKADVVDMVKKSGSGFKELKMVTDYIADRYEKLGDVKVTEPKKRKGLFGDPSALQSEITITNGDKEAVLALEPMLDRGIISIHLDYPRLGYGSGGDYNIKKKSYRLDSLDRDLKEIFIGS